MKCRHAKDTDLKSICNLLAYEFYNDPVLRFAFTHTNREQRLAKLKSFFSIYINLAMKCGGILLAENNIGVLVYFRPEVMAMDDEENKRIDYLLRQACGSDYEQVIALMNGLNHYHPHKDPHFYVFLIAVRGSFRRKGVATGLLATLNAMLDREAMACYAECTALTTQHLFEQLGYSDMTSPLIIEGFPRLYPVWREPAVIALNNAGSDVTLRI